jgi:hypothetical protein
MANYLSLEKTPPTYPVSGVGLGGRVGKHGRGQYTVVTALAANDTIQLLDLPRNARVVSGFIKSDAVDSASAVTYNVGIAGTPALFFSGSTVGRTGGGVDRNLAFAGTDYVATAKTPVILTIGAGPTTGVTGGTIVVVITYTVEEPA